MRNMQHRWTKLPIIRFFGAEDDEGKILDPLKGAESDDPAIDDKPSEDKFSSDYVEKLRKENADRRIAAKEAGARATAAETELAKIKQAEMSDLEAATTALETERVAKEEAITAATTAAATLKSVRIQNAVTMAAIEAGFEDPSDALSMISQDDLVDDEGNIVSATVTKRLNALAAKKPYLLKAHRPGRGDGGPAGKPGDPDTHEGKAANYLKQMTETGGRVPR